MPHGLFKRGHHSSGHKHHNSEKDADKVPIEEYAELQQQIQDLREELDDAAENLQLAKLSARTLEDHFRSEIDDAKELRSSFLASEAQVAELESQARAGRGDAAELSSSLAEQRARVAELETQHVATEEQHKAVVSKLAGEAMAKASDADDAKVRLAQLQQTLAEVQAEAGELRKSVAAPALADSLLNGEVDTLRTEVDQLRRAQDKHAVEQEEMRSLSDQLRDLQGCVAGRDKAVAELEVKLQLAEVQQEARHDDAELASIKSELAASNALAVSLQSQLDAGAEQRSRSSAEKERDDAQLAVVKLELAERSALVARLQSQLHAAAEETPKSRGETPKSRGETSRDDVELASVKAELAERSDRVASLQLQLDAAAEEGLRLVDANTTLEEQLQEETEKSTQLSERLDSSVPAVDAEAMKEKAEHTVERSAALLAEVVAFQTECESLRREVDEAAHRPNLELLVEQATGRSAELLASLAASEVLTTELSSAEATAEEANAMLRDELKEAEALEASRSQTTDELREELARECAGHSAAAAAADNALAAHTALRSEVAEAESAVEDSETCVGKLQAELSRERAGRESETHAANAAQQSLQSGKVHQDEVHALRDELTRERRQSNAEVAALAAAREQLAAAPMPDSGSHDEIQELLAEVSDLKYALNVTSEAAACLDDSGEPVGVQEARRFRAECAQLQSELQRSKATAAAASASAMREQRITADFGDAGSGNRHATLHGGSQLNQQNRSTPSFTSCPQEVKAISAKGDADEKNPFSDASSEEEEEPSTGDDPPAFTFMPPGRAAPAAAAAQGAGNPFGEEAFDEPDSTNPFQEPAGNPFDLESSQGSPAQRNPFAADGAADVSRDDLEVLEPQTPSQSLSRGQHGSVDLLTNDQSTPSFSSKDVAAAQAAAAAEVAHLRAALQSEEEACVEAKAACAEAREEAARGAKRALAAASGADAGAEAGEVHQLRRALSDEAAKSRRLCEQALRAEESRRRLLQEMLEDSQAEVDVVQLAKLVGRAAKAIAAVSEVAPVRPAEQVPVSGMPATSTPAGSPPRSASAPEASASQPGSTPQSATIRTPQRLPCLPGLPAGSLSDVAVTPSRLQGIPGIPGPAARSPRGSMPTPSAYMDLR
mmetsp:Transcript_46269/g.82161  ORF Transcript_46269/g.82161 Transcript_46269/m.82161 type:complete len:1130 (-) Transcript_46269:74-3463(-)